MLDLLQCIAVSPVTGDGFRPWIAAVILIISVIVLVGMIIFSRKDDSGESGKSDSFEDEDQ